MFTTKEKIQIVFLEEDVWLAVEKTLNNNCPLMSRRKRQWIATIVRAKVSSSIEKAVKKLKNSE